jgi:hypothetical protein
LAITIAMIFALPVPVFASPPEPTSAAPTERPDPEPLPVEGEPVPPPDYGPHEPDEPDESHEPEGGATVEGSAAPVKPHRNRGLGMTFMGFGMFGTTYLINGIVATSLIDQGDTAVGRPMLIPVAGPFIAGAHAQSATVGFAIGIGGVFQIAGLALGITGAVRLGKSRARARNLALGPNGVVLRF